MMVRDKFARMSDLKTEIGNIRAVSLILSATSTLERIFWANIPILGSIWIATVFLTQVKFWNENHVLITKGTKNLSQLHLPAVTLCHKGIQKFGFVERMVNYVDVEKEIPKEIFEIRNEAIKAEYQRFRQSENMDDQEDFCDLVKRDIRFFGRLKNFDGCNVRKYTLGLGVRIQLKLCLILYRNLRKGLKPL